MTWLSNTIGNITSWLGDGLGRFFQWLISGIGTVVSKVVEAATGIFDVFDAIWNFAAGIVQSLLDLVGTYFPFIPAPVVLVIGAAMTAALIAGIYKRVRG